jgi:hypothetical protein
LSARDELRSAYAALGLEPGASLRVVKRQFKTIVRKWHPDRFVGDPQGIVEANQRLRVINQAYNTILASFRPLIPQIRRDPPPPPAPPRSDNGSSARAPDEPPRPRPVMERLTPEQIDAIVDALKAHGRRPSLTDQIRTEPWNRGLSLAVAVAFIVEGAWTTWRNPWPTLSAWHVKPTMPATGPLMASMVMSALLMWPLLYAIWYSDKRTRIVGWIFLVLIALVLPAFTAMARS